jgi:hypothetical protein
MIAGRLLSLSTVALVGVLGIVFAAWSGFTNPDVAGQQLEAAAQNSAAAPNFTDTINESESLTGSNEAILVHEVVHYEAPDRQEAVETTRIAGIPNPYSYTRTLTQIGNSCWTTVSGPAELEPLACRTANSHPLRFDLADAWSDVTDNDGTYSLGAAATHQFLSHILSTPFGMASFEARISGSYMNWQRIAFVTSTQDGTFQIVETAELSDIGSSPSVIRPSGPATATA